MGLIKKVAELENLEQKATPVDGAVLFQDEQEEGECIQISPSCYEGGVEGWRKTGEVLIVKNPNDKDSWPELLATFERPDDAAHYVALRNAAPAMLVVLECFREGDAEVLTTPIDYLESIHGGSEYEDIELAALKRLQKAAQLMEAKDDG